MNGKEKLYFLLDAIDDARTISPEGSMLIIDPTNDLNNSIRNDDLFRLFAKLTVDDKVINFVKGALREKSDLDEFDPYPKTGDGCYHIELLPAFDDYYLKIQHEPEYQEFTGKKPIANSIETNSNIIITYEEKLELIIGALVDARKATRQGQSTILYLHSTNGLAYLNTEEIRNILLQLQDEKVITVNPKTNRLLPINQQPLNPSYFILDILNSFDNWYIAYQLKQKSKIENLSDTNFQEVYSVLIQIENQLQINQSNKFNFTFVTSIYDIEGYDGQDVDELANGYIRILEYLKKISVVKDYAHAAMSLDADVTLDIARYLEVLEIAKKVQQRKQEPAKVSTPINDKIKVTYDPKKGLLSVGIKSVQLKRESFRAKLIEFILKDEVSRKKEWSWDEVIEAIEETKDTELTKESKLKFYPACDGLSKHIALKIGINDLLIFNKSTVQINPKYL